MFETSDSSDPLLIAMRAFERVLLGAAPCLERVETPPYRLELVDQRQTARRQVTCLRGKRDSPASSASRRRGIANARAGPLQRRRDKGMRARSRASLTLRPRLRTSTIIEALFASTRKRVGSRSKP